MAAGSAAGRRAGPSPRIGISTGDSGVIREVGQPGFEQFLVGRRAEADGVGEALAHRRAVVRDAGRQVQHVAGFEDPLLLGAEVREELQRGVRNEGEIALAADAPATAPPGLQQEHVVRVDVRTDAAAVGRVAHHQVVEPGIGHEAEPAEQRVRACVQQVDALHEQRPVADDGSTASRWSGPCFIDQRSPMRAMSRDSTSSRRASSNSASRDTGGTNPGNALRISSGRRCQASRMKRATGIEPSRCRTGDVSTRRL